jgi:hypothetical protein
MNQQVFEWQRTFADYVLVWGGDTMNESGIDFHHFRNGLYVVVAHQCLHLVDSREPEEMEEGLMMMSVNDDIDIETRRRWASLIPARPRAKRTISVLPWDTIHSWLKHQVGTVEARFAAATPMATRSDRPERLNRPAFMEVQALMNREMFGRTWEHKGHTGLFWKPVLRRKLSQPEESKPTPLSLSRPKNQTVFPPPVVVKWFPPFHPLTYLPDDED